MPRSTAISSETVGASCRPLAATTFPAVPATGTATVTVALPRSFKPRRSVEVVLASALPAGVVISGPVVVTGNSPSSGATPAVYSATITLANLTAAAITPAAQIIALYQS